MRTTPRTEDEAKRASSRTLFKPGWYPARITAATERDSRRGFPMIELDVLIRDSAGERSIKDYLSDSDRGAAKLRTCCVAVDALELYERGEVGQDDFPGHDIEAKIIIEKRRGFPDQNRIEDYRRASASSVVSLRSAG